MQERRGSRQDLKGSQSTRPVPGVEIGMYVDWTNPIPVEDPPECVRPPVVLKMPAYVAGGLAHLLHRFALVRGVIGAGGEDGSSGEWEKVAPALLAVARLAAGGDRYPELADLGPGSPPTPGHTPGTPGTPGYVDA